MDTRNGFLETIGNTPLIRLRKFSEETGCDIYGKAEFLNPGGSVKDRAALAIVEDAERRGELRPGGLIVEGTAGNTGIGLSLVGNARGYRTLIVIPTHRARKRRTCSACAEQTCERSRPSLTRTPKISSTSHEALAEEHAKEEEHGAIWANQFDNLANRQGHFETTGPEIWDQTDGKIDAFICSVGTGGSLWGVGTALKERNPDVIIGLADPEGAAIYNHFKHGEAKATEGSSISEGIGQARITANIEGTPIDIPYTIPDSEWLPIAFDLLQHEGLCVGGSAAINVAGAIRLAKEVGPGKKIVTLLCDSGTRYQSKMFNPDFLRSKDLPLPSWL